MCTRKVFFMLASLFSFSQKIFSASEHWDERQASLYVKHSELQNKSTWMMLPKYIGKFKRNSYILDIGCGDGRNTSILANFSKEGKTIGIDPNENMLAIAKRKYIPQEFSNLSFKKGEYNSLKEFEDESFDIVSGFFSFQYINSDEKEQSVQEIQRILKKDGFVLFVMPPDMPEFWSESIRESLQSPKWTQYFQIPSKKINFDSLEFLEEIFKKHFTEVTISFEKSFDPFGKKDFIKWICGTLPFIQKVPKSKRENLASDIIDLAATKKKDFLVNGIYYPSFGRIEVYARK